MARDCMRGHAIAFPLRLRSRDFDEHPDTSQPRLSEQFEAPDVPLVSNLSKSARLYLTELGINDQDYGSDTGDLIWMHALGIGFSPAYLKENTDGIRQDWPRVPLPATKDPLLASAALGERLAGLLDPESSVEGETFGTIRPEVKSVGLISRIGGGRLAEKQLRLTARWGYAGQNRVTMPGPGDARIRDYTEDECAAIEQGAEALGLTIDEAFTCLGGSTYDIHLNDVAYWRNVPSRVWRYTIGGYRVIKKWLSYREFDLLGRPLRTEEVREVTDSARRIAAILLIEPALDASYRAVSHDTYAWPRDD